MIGATAGARSLATQVVARILDDGVTLDAALEATLADAPRELVPPVRSLSFGAVRGFYRHEAILGRVLSQPTKSLDVPVRALLSVALFELEDARTPQYAVVDAAVETTKSIGVARAAGLVNAVLRRYLRERGAVDREIARNPALRHASPQWLAERFRADWPGRWTQLLAAGDTQAPMWLRVNQRRVSAQDYLQTLRAADIGARLEPRVPQALVLEAPRDVAGSPWLRAGPGFGAGPRSAMRRFSVVPRTGSEGARRLRRARRQDGADGRA